MFDLDLVSKRLYEIAETKNPFALANYIYFIIKQFPGCPFCKSFEENISRTKNLIEEVYEWDESLSSIFEKEFRSLTRYLKKSD
jgi:hypothetical protein